MPSALTVPREDVPAQSRGLLSELNRIVAMGNPISRQELQSRAFGEPGQDGNPHRLQHLAGHIAAVYEDLSDWSSNVRSLSVPMEHASLFLRLSDLASRPIDEYRKFVGSVVATLDRRTELAEDGSKDDPVGIELTLTPTMTRRCRRGRSKSTRLPPATETPRTDGGAGHFGYRLMGGRRVSVTTLTHA